MSTLLRAVTIMVALAALAAAPWPARAEMQIRLKDGRVLTLPVEADQVESITFGAGRRDSRSPAARAAEQAGRGAAPAPSAPVAAAAPGRGGRVLRVGPGGAYAVPSAAARAARDGDTVEIAAGRYVGDVAVWTAHNLTLRGVGGWARLDADGKMAEGKAIWVIKGNNATVEHLEFSGGRVADLNGAGIRLEGAGLTVRRCAFFGNEIGILTGNNPSSDVLVEHSEFGRNRIDYERYAREGRAVARSVPPGHNIYIGQLRSFTLRFSYVHHAEYGHNVKSRALRNVIAYNRIGDEADGRSSYAIDLPNGGWTLIVGNVIHQGERTENSTVVNFGSETRSGTQPLYVVNNTFVNDRGAGTFVRRAAPGPTRLVNNIFAGGGQPLLGGGALRGNLIVGKPGLGARLFGAGDGKARPGSGDLAGNLVAEAAGFVAAPSHDYRLAKGSPAIDAGEDPGSADGVALAPAAQYRHPLGAQPRTPRGRIDIGAYEFAAE